MPGSKPSAIVRLSPKAEEYLIEHGQQLDPEQRREVEALFSQLKADPHAGKRHQEEVAWLAETLFYIERYLGKKVWMLLHYDIVSKSECIDVEVKGVWIGHKM